MVTNSQESAMTSDNTSNLATELNVDTKTVEKQHKMDNYYS